MKKIIVHQGQSLLDIAIQHSGSIEAAFDFTILNDVSISDDLKTGESLIVPKVINRRVFNYYERNEIVPATALNETTISNEGISYWAINIDFIVN